MAPWGGVQPFFSTNPIAAGIPREQGPPIVIDISTSVTSVGKLKTLANQEAEAPKGWLINGEGSPCTDPGTFFSQPQRSAILPLGGLLAGHKGFALNLLVDILAGALSGAGCSTGEDIEHSGNGLLVLAIDPDKFVSQKVFTEFVEELIRKVKASKKAPQKEEILIPGERAFRERHNRLKEGIPIDPTTWKQIKDILDDLGIERGYVLEKT
jgi:uncharacterized oxidoreductase